MKAKKAFEDGKGRERRVAELAAMFDDIASSPDRRLNLDVFYASLRGLDDSVPQMHIALGKRELYEEDLARVREALGKLDESDLDRLTESVRRLYGKGGAGLRK